MSIPFNKNAILSTEVNNSCTAIVVKENDDIVFSKIYRYDVSDTSAYKNRGGYRRNRRTLKNRVKRRRAVIAFLKRTGLYHETPNGFPNIQVIAGDAYERRLSVAEFCAVILHLNNRRGHFHSPSEKNLKPYGVVGRELKLGRNYVTNKNRKNKKKDDVDVKNDIENDVDVENVDSKSEDKKKSKTKEKPIIIERDIESTKNEIRSLFEFQNSFGLIGENYKELAEELCNIVAYKRKPTWDASVLGICPLEGEHVVLMSHPAAYEYNLWKNINNLRVNEFPLHSEQREKLYNAIKRRQVDHSKSKNGRPAMPKAITASEIKAVLGVSNVNHISFAADWHKELVRVFGKKTAYKLWSVILFASTDEDISEWCYNNKMPKDLIEQAIYFKGNIPKKKSAYSEKALRNLLPFIKKGMSERKAIMSYADAIQSEKPHLANRYRKIYKPTLSSKNRHLLKQLTVENFDLSFINKNHGFKKVGNCVMHQTLKCMMMAMEEIVKTLGYLPGSIVVELCREAYSSESKIESETKKIEKNQKANQDLRDAGARTKIEMRRLKLLKIQNNLILDISNDQIITRYCSDEEAISGQGLHIDHCVPRSLEQIDKIDNLLLTTQAFNNYKGTKFLSNMLSEDRLKELFEELYCKKTKCFKSRWFFFNYDPSDIEQKNALLKRVGIESVAYVSVYLKDLLNDLVWCATGNRPTVYCAKGEITARLRHEFNVRKKERGVIFHHIEDCILNTQYHNRIMYDIEKATRENVYLQPYNFSGGAEKFKELVEIQSMLTKIVYVRNGHAISGGLHKDTLLKHKSNKVSEKSQIVYGDRRYALLNYRCMDLMKDKKGKHFYSRVINNDVAERYKNRSQSFKSGLKIKDLPVPFHPSKDSQFVYRIEKGTIIELNQHGVWIPYFVQSFESKALNMKCLWIAADSSINRKRIGSNQLSMLNKSRKAADTEEKIRKCDKDIEEHHKKFPKGEYWRFHKFQDVFKQMPEYETLKDVSLALSFGKREFDKGPNFWRIVE